MIYPEVHVLADTLVPVMSPYTTWFGDSSVSHTEPLKRRHKNLPNGEKF
jgi:hypothetical protein